MADLSPIIMAEPVESVEHELALLSFQMALETAKCQSDVILIVGNVSEQLNRIGRVLAAQVAGVCLLVDSGLSCAMLSPTEEDSCSMAELMRQELERTTIKLQDFTMSFDDYSTDPIFFPPSPRPPAPRTIGRPTGARCQPYHLQRKVLPCNRR